MAPVATTQKAGIWDRLDAITTAYGKVQMIDTSMVRAGRQALGLGTFCVPISGMDSWVRAICALDGSNFNCRILPRPAVPTLQIDRL
jgi:hypothetical protein